MVARLVRDQEVVGSNPVASTTRNEANVCWLHFALSRTSTGFEGGGASGSERFARELLENRRDGRKLNSPVGCSPGRAAKGANPVATKRLQRQTSARYGVSCRGFVYISCFSADFAIGGIFCSDGCILPLFPQKQVLDP